jgi:predicted AlkP superfamily pyrophosphatase or phosphodiesterase
MDRIQAIHGFPLAHVWPLTAADEPYLYAALFNASQGQEWKVYRKADVPSYLHHRHSDRIAPIVAIPPLGWIFGRKNAFDGHGMHGYDPRLEAMHAVFIARGPAFIRSQGKPAPYFSNTQVYGILARVLDVHAAPNNGSEFWLDRSGLLKGNG